VNAPADIDVNPVAFSMCRSLKPSSFHMRLRGSPFDKVRYVGLRPDIEPNKSMLHGLRTQFPWMSQQYCSMVWTTLLCAHKTSEITRLKGITDVTETSLSHMPPEIWEIVAWFAQ
jgi:hypothetical protein